MTIEQQAAGSAGLCRELTGPTVKQSSGIAVAYAQASPGWQTRHLCAQRLYAGLAKHCCKGGVRGLGETGEMGLHLCWKPGQQWLWLSWITCRTRPLTVLNLCGPLTKQGRSREHSELTDVHGKVACVTLLVRRHLRQGPGDTQIKRTVNY